MNSLFNLYENLPFPHRVQRKKEQIIEKEIIAFLDKSVSGGRDMDGRAGKAKREFFQRSRSQS